MMREVLIFNGARRTAASGFAGRAGNRRTAAAIAGAEQANYMHLPSRGLDNLHMHSYG
jgi:hypothetical protein